MRQMEHDLEAGDEEFGLVRAKAAFRAVLAALRDSDAESGPSYAAMLASEYSDDCGGEMDPIQELCDAEHLSPEQTKKFKMRLRDAIPIVDAILCKPPPGQQLEIVKVRDTLRRKRTHLPTVMEEDDGGGLANSSTLANEVDQLVRDLHGKEGDLAVLKDTQKTHCAVLERIGSDWNAGVVDIFPDFATHYMNKIPRKPRKPKDTGTMRN
ncbi:hypothetical protein BBJ28_00021132 [Nothophytophthora sp. Chile5]|nr:hypothetical protein BBJ28_00021132 [Nothophytophthora sp. Chile5]